MSLQLVRDDENTPNASPLNTAADVTPPLSPMLPMPRVIRNPNDPVTKQDADFATQMQIMLLDYLDARFELGLIPNRDDQSEQGRTAAMAALAQVMQQINAPYIATKQTATAARSVLQISGQPSATPSPAPLVLTHAVLDELLRRVLVYGVAVINAAPKLP